MPSSKQQPNPFHQRLIPFLLFNGNLQSVLSFYAAVLPDAKIESLVSMEKEPGSDEGRVLTGILSFLGQRIMFLDVGNECPPFSWSTSFYVICNSDDEFDAILTGLGQDGEVLLGPVPVFGFRKLAWITDKFGVTWQPVLE